MALTRWLSSTAHASLETLKQTTRSNPGSGIPPAMALASAALLGVVSTFSWSNVLKADNLKANVQQKQATQEGSPEGSDAAIGTETDYSSASDFGASARQEIQGLIRS
ncbi:hypothetical protein ABBQ32_010317 [Trebouxia sp. C0010 RCD-2024]